MDQEKQDSNREKIQVLKELSNKLKEYVETVKNIIKQSKLDLQNSLKIEKNLRKEIQIETYFSTCVLN